MTLTRLTTGDWGLDLVLGGGLTLFPRHEGGVPSASVLLRGGPGAGKTTLALQLATVLARELGGDVVYGCVELLPTELRAQAESVWGPGPAGSGDKQAAVPATSILIPSAASAGPPRFGARDGESTHVYASLLRMDTTSREEALASFGDAVLHLLDVAAASGARPRVLVIDSLAEGYHLAGAPREVADAITKLAGERGLVAVLVEEAEPGAPSHWTYAVDVVLELEHLDRTQERGPRLWLAKNRFGPAEAGPHPFSVVAREGIRVLPAPGCYLSPAFQRQWSVARPAQLYQRGYGLQLSLGGLVPAFSDSSVMLVGPEPSDVRALARQIGSINVDGTDVWIELGAPAPSVAPFREGEHRLVAFDDPRLGAARFLHDCVDALDATDRAIRRVLIGDLAALASFARPDELRGAVLSLLTIARRGGLPVILFETRPARIETVLLRHGPAVSPAVGGSGLAPASFWTDVRIELIRYRRGGSDELGYDVYFADRAGSTSFGSIAEGNQLLALRTRG